MPPIAIAGIAFLFLFLVVGMIGYGILLYRRDARVNLQEKIAEYSTPPGFQENYEILKKKRKLSDITTFNLLLSRLPGIRRLDDLVKQANAPYPLGVYLLSGAVLAIMGYMLSNVWFGDALVGIILSAVLFSLPLVHLMIKKENRLKKFKAQLPEGLDLIARSLKAGHAFTSGLRLAAEEFDDPLGTEMKETLDEINFGLSTEEALKNLGRRVDCLDLKFFVVSANLQKETGGNLAEIIEAIAHLIRERFKFQDKVRALSAEGKLSAIILISIPILMMIFLRASNPDYLDILFTDPLGRLMLVLGGVGMFVGALVIRKIVQVEV